MTKVIVLNTLEKVREFANIICTFDSDIDMYKDNKNKAQDAKSIMAIFIMDLNSPLHVYINSNDKDELERFDIEMDKFKE